MRINLTIFFGFCYIRDENSKCLRIKICSPHFHRSVFAEMQRMSLWPGTRYVAYFVARYPAIVFQFLFFLKKLDIDLD